MSKQPRPCRDRCGQCLQCDEYENYIEQDDNVPVEQKIYNTDENYE